MSAATPGALRGDIDCPPCGGSGMVALPPRPDGLLDERECSACRGTGRIVPATYATTSPPGAAAPGDAAQGATVAPCSRAVLEVLVYPCREAGRWGARARGRARDGSTRTVAATAWDREEALRSAAARWYAEEDAVR